LCIVEYIGVVGVAVRAPLLRWRARGKGGGHERAHVEGKEPDMMVVRKEGRGRGERTEGGGERTEDGEARFE
jgi:hypothetical protein